MLLLTIILASLLICPILISIRKVLLIQLVIKNESSYLNRIIVRINDTKEWVLKKEEVPYESLAHYHINNLVITIRSNVFGKSLDMPKFLNAEIPLSRGELAYLCDKFIALVEKKELEEKNKQLERSKKLLEQL